MNQLTQINKDLILKKWRKLLKQLKELTITEIGKFIDEEVSAHMELSEFAELIKDEEGALTYRQLCKYRKLYKSGMQSAVEEVGIEKAEIASRIQDRKVRKEFVERGKEVSTKQLSAEVSSYIKSGITPTEEVKSTIQINLRYKGAALKLISQLVMFRQALKQNREEKIFDSFPQGQKEQFSEYLSKIKIEYEKLTEEVEKNLEYLRGEKDGKKKENR